MNNLDQTKWPTLLASLLKGEAKFGPVVATPDETAATELLTELTLQNVTWRDLSNEFCKHLEEERKDPYLWPRLLAALSKRFRHLLP